MAQSNASSFANLQNAIRQDVMGDLQQRAVLTVKQDLAYGVNVGEPAITVKHSTLTPADDGRYKSECPKCKNGLLLVTRDQTNFNLVDTDRCVSCGQLFIYEDIGEMRKSDYSRSPKINQGQIINIGPTSGQLQLTSGLVRDTIVLTSGRTGGSSFAVRPNVGDTYFNRELNQMTVFDGNDWVIATEQMSVPLEPPKPPELGERKLKLD